MTVSLALRDDPRLTEDTRQRIQKLAREMNYQRDPMLSALVNYRLDNTKRHYQGALAVLAYPHWKNVPHYRDVFKGASERAAELGYSLDFLPTPGTKNEVTGLSRKLHLRGVLGILIVRGLEDDIWSHFPWDDYAIVAATQCIQSRNVLTVTADPTTASRRVWHEVVSRGYKRVGVILQRKADEAVQQRFYFAFIGEQSLLKRGSIRISPVYLEPNQSQEFRQWFRKNSPDAIIAFDPDFLRLLESEGISVPGNVGFAAIKLAEEDGSICGNYQPAIETGVEAINLLDARIRNNVHGFSRRREQLLLDGHWIEGSTLQPHSAPIVENVR